MVQNMNIQEIYSLIDRFEYSGIVSMELEMKDVKLSLRKQETVQAEDAASNQTSRAETNKTSRAETNTASNRLSAAENNISPNQETRADNSADDSAAKCEVKAPLVGTFYRAASPEDEPYVVVGKKVSRGDVIGIIEAMKIMNEVLSPVDGEVISVNSADGELVEFDQVLVTIKES